MSPARSLAELFSLKGRVALVTGASRGLGQAFAGALAEAGADLVIACRHHAELDQTAALAKAHGRQVLALGADIRRLYVADASGRVFEGRDIAAGAGQTLAAAPGRWQLSAGAQAELRQVFAQGDWLATLDGMSRTSEARFLAPGGYVAFLDQSPFIESPIAGAKCEHTVAIVCGISEGPGDGR